MKKLNKKLLGIGVIVLFFIISLISLVRAQVVEEQEFFRVNSASTTPAGAKRAGDEALIHIANRSGKSYFAPNKTLPEFESFRNNAPKYVAVSVCGDGVCGEGENVDNCDYDCSPPQTKYVDYCGDGICNQKLVCTTTPTTVTITNKSDVCNRVGFADWFKRLRHLWLRWCGKFMPKLALQRHDEFSDKTVKYINDIS